MCLPDRILCRGRYPRQPGKVRKVNTGPAGKRVVAGQEGNVRLGLEGQGLQATEKDGQTQNR